MDCFRYMFLNQTFAQCENKKSSALSLKIYKGTVLLQDRPVPVPNEVTGPIKMAHHKWAIFFWTLTSAVMGPYCTTHPVTLTTEGFLLQKSLLPLPEKNIWDLHQPGVAEEFLELGTWLWPLKWGEKNMIPVRCDDDSWWWWWWWWWWWSMIYEDLMIHDAANDADLWWSSIIVVYKCLSKNSTPDLPSASHQDTAPQKHYCKRKPTGWHCRPATGKKLPFLL